MENKMNVSLFWDGLNHYSKMILHDEQYFLESYIDFVNSHRGKGVKKIFVIKGEKLYYRKPMTKDLIQIGGDNFGGCCNEDNRISFLVGGTVDKKVWDEWFDTDNIILDDNLKKRVSEDKDFIKQKTEFEKQICKHLKVPYTGYNVRDRDIVEFFCEDKCLSET
jgi:hypothetical protein